LQASQTLSAYKTMSYLNIQYNANQWGINIWIPISVTTAVKT